MVANMPIHDFLFYDVLVALSLFGAVCMLIVPSFRGFVAALFLCMASAAVLALLGGMMMPAAILGVFSVFLPVFLAAFVPGQKCLRKRAIPLLVSLIPVMVVVGWLLYAAPAMLPRVPAGKIPDLTAMSLLLSEQMPGIMLALLPLFLAVLVGSLSLSVGRRSERIRQPFAWQIRQTSSRVLFSAKGEESKS